MSFEFILSNNIENQNTLNMFKSILGNNFSQFEKRIPYCGFATPGVHYCVLRDKG